MLNVKEIYNPIAYYFYLSLKNRSTHRSANAAMTVASKPPENKIATLAFP